MTFTIAQRVADRYRIDRSIARGGGGVILAATDLRTTCQLVVKALADYKTTRPDGDEGLELFVESLLRLRHHLQCERRLLVQLQRRGCNAIPAVIDYAYDYNPILAGPHQTESGQSWHFDDDSIIGSEPYLVLERVRGKNLQELLEEHYEHGLSESLALRIIDQVAAVLELLHEPLAMPGGQTWYLVYQDLKPGNIMVQPNGLVTILDFGGCQLRIADTIVLNGSYTPGYCPPECGDPSNRLTPATDCYCLGTTLFHMLTGRNPRRLLAEQHESGAGGHPRALQITRYMLSGHCSRAVADIVMKCLDWDPERRFQSMTEFRDAIEPLLDSPASLWRPVRLPQPAGPDDANMQPQPGGQEA